jgi:hypothetical protein
MNKVGDSGFQVRDTLSSSTHIIFLTCDFVKTGKGFTISERTCCVGQIISSMPTNGAC